VIVLFAATLFQEPAVQLGYGLAVGAVYIHAVKAHSAHSHEHHQCDDDQPHQYVVNAGDIHNQKSLGG